MKPSSQVVRETSSGDVDWSNEEWILALQDHGPRREAAIARLRRYLLRAILLYLSRQRSDLVGMDFSDLQQLAEDWTQQALLQVLDRLSGFRGDSKFTTWAYRVAINLAAAELRRKHWANLSLEMVAETQGAEAGIGEDLSAVGPEEHVTRQEIWRTVRRVIVDELTERQRTVLIEIVLNGVPVEVVAEQLGTNRNNIYKILHDARRKLKGELMRNNWSAEEILAAFGSGPS